MAADGLVDKGSAVESGAAGDAEALLEHKAGLLDLPPANTERDDPHPLDIGSIVEEGDRSWVVIMTFGHAHDRQVLEGLLDRDFAYLGLMGSKNKVRQMYAAMVADGISESALADVTSPVGMSIGSHTPEEIAISIAAEIISLQNRS